VLGVLAALSFAAAVPLSLLSHQMDNGLIAAVIGVPCAAVGSLVTRRQPGNPIGWLFLVTGIFIFLSTAGGDYGYYVYRLGHHLPLAGAGLATQVLQFHSTVAVAAATLAAAALFSPLRRRVQHMVDRRFNRARYNAGQTVAAFAARLKDAVDLDAIRDDLAGVASQALEPAHLSVWISQRG
jgi:hypothetical protein